MLYYGAMALYIVLGLAFGLLLGRLTRRQNAEVEANTDDGGHQT
jgi:hypothetical protein